MEAREHVYCHHVYVDQSASQAASWRTASMVSSKSWSHCVGTIMLVCTMRYANIDYTSELSMPAIRGVISTIVNVATT